MATLAAFEVVKNRLSRSDIPRLPRVSVSLRDLVWIAIFAGLLRLCVCAITLNRDGISLFDYASLRDGLSYMRMAEALLGNLSAPSMFDRRVFIGYPASIAVVAHLGLSIPVAALLVSWLGAAASAALAALYFDDARVGWILAAVFPSHVMYSSLVTSEPLLLTLILLGLLVCRRDWVVLGGLLLGLAGLVRPMACFAVLGYLGGEVLKKEYKRPLIVAVVSGAVVLGGYLFIYAWSGDAIQGVRIYATHKSAYGGHLLAWPFQSLIFTPLDYPVPLWKVAYIWLHVVVVLIASWRAMVVARGVFLRKEATSSIFVLVAIWLVGNTAFVLCIGSIWGFQEFHRFMTPALPPLAFVVSPIAPRRRWLYVAASLITVPIALFGISPH